MKPFDRGNKVIFRKEGIGKDVCRKGFWTAKVTYGVFLGTGEQRHVSILWLNREFPRLRVRRWNPDEEWKMCSYSTGG